MRGFRAFIVLLIIACSACVHKRDKPERPKIVIGLVIDQMRWDYLYRYYDVYSKDGFKRILRDGYNCQNTTINYLPTYTAPGHAGIYTGSVPAINGIAGNDWIDNQTGAFCYCVEDKGVYLAGDPAKEPSMSPKNLLTSTITDELRLATNLHSRVYSISLKDRSAILPGGHLANAAYWYNEKTGDIATSTYYSNQNPNWLQVFNKRRAGDSLIRQGWSLLYKDTVYKQSTVDANNYEASYKMEKAPVFPHKFDSLQRQDRFAVLKAIPAGNTYVLMAAKACMEGEKLGKGMETDFLALSLSSTDYIGHQFAPNSIEVEDCYLRLDLEIAALLRYLDKQYGKNGYLLFVTADHGGAHNAAFLSDMDVPAGVVNKNVFADLNAALKSQFGKDSLVRGIVNAQVFLNDTLINGKQITSAVESTPHFKQVRVRTGRGRHVRYKTISVRVSEPKPGAIPMDREKIKDAVTRWLNKRPEVAYVIDMEDMNKVPVPEPIRTMVINGYNRTRSGTLQIILNPAWYDNGGKTTGTTHGNWNPYDAHIPLLWYGWHIPKGETNRSYNMTDIAPTLAALLHIQAPNGCIGKPIVEVTDKSK